MLGRALQRLILVFSIGLASGVSVFWFLGQVADGWSDYQFYYRTGKFTDANGGKVTLYSFYSGNEVIVVLQDVTVLPPHDPSGPGMSGHSWAFYSINDPYFAVEWKYGGFWYGRYPSGELFVSVPYWSFIAIGLVAPAVMMWRRGLWRPSRLVLAGRCPHCGFRRQEERGCSVCGAAPSWLLEQAFRMRSRRWYVWCSPAAVFSLCMWVARFFDADRWLIPFGFLGLASLASAVLMQSAFALAGIFSNDPPRGFEVVMKPPASGGDGTAKPGGVKRDGPRRKAVAARSSFRRICAIRAAGAQYDGLSAGLLMLKRIVSVFILAASLLVAVGISALWFTGYSADFNNPQEIGRWACDFDPATGGMAKGITIGSFDGGIYFLGKSEVLLSKTQYGRLYYAGCPPDQVAEAERGFAETYSKLAGRNVWYHGGGMPWELLTRLNDLAPNWAYGGFKLNPVNRWATGSSFAVVIPDWSILAVALIAPANFVWGSVFLRAGRRVLSGCCRHCGCDRWGGAGWCPQCGVGPSWAGRQTMRLGNWRWILWWAPAVVIAVCALCVPGDSLVSYDYALGWAGVLVGLAFLYMIGVAVARGFVARQPPPQAPRGFEVVIKPPASGGDGNKKAGV